MKNFDGWLESQMPVDPFCCQFIAKDAWRAALEWAMELTLVNDYASEYFISKRKIKEELDD
jgi:hypothetical protein